MNRKPLSYLLWSMGGVLCFLSSIVIAVSWGSVKIPLDITWQVILAHFYPLFSMDPSTEAIVWDLRLPRVLLAGLVGASLSVAGVIFQGLLQNSLADPYILGVSSGAAAGAVVAIVIGFAGDGIAVSAFAGACLALLLVLYVAAKHKRFSIHRLILSGVVIQSFFGAIVSFLLSISYENVQTIVFWLLGSFSLAGWQDVSFVALFLCGSLFIAWLLSRQLNIFAFGDISATYLGVSVTKVRLVLLVTASLLTAVSVSVSGTIGFVGLVIPHIMRFFIGIDHRILFPFAALGGAIFMIWADLVSRLVIAPQELSIGVVTAMIGAPFFAFLLKKGGNHFHA